MSKAGNHGFKKRTTISPDGLNEEVRDKIAHLYSQAFRTGDDVQFLYVEGRGKGRPSALLRAPDGISMPLEEIAESVAFFSTYFVLHNTNDICVFSRRSPQFRHAGLRGSSYKHLVFVCRASKHEDVVSPWETFKVYDFFEITLLSS